LGTLIKLVGALLSTSNGRTQRRDTTPRVHRVPPMDSGQVAHQWPELGEFEFEVVGEASYRDALEHIAQTVGTGDVFQVLLVPETHNPYDENAVSVRYKDEVIAYMSRSDAKSFRRRLSAKKLSGAVTQCQAIIVGGHKLKDGSVANYGVLLDIKVFA